MEVEHSYETFQMLKWCQEKKQIPFIFMKNFLYIYKCFEEFTIKLFQVTDKLKKKIRL